MTLSPLDLAIISVPLIIAVTITLALRRYLRSVADFLAASRCAGRYLMATSLVPGGSAVMTTVVALELFSKVGYSIGFWLNFTAAFTFLFTLFGVVTYRFRETRCLTFHQFLEVRYSKGVRVFTSLAALVSGVLGFGLMPAIGARFMVYFCGLSETLRVGGQTVPTFAVIMIVLMGFSMFLAMTGGQISVMVTDCVEGLVSSFFYLIVVFFVLRTISTGQMREALLSGSPGQSYINPFDITSRHDFNGRYILMVFIFNIYIFRGNAWSGSSVAAKNAHEGKMSGIVAFWRGFGSAAMLTLVSIAAFVVLHHPAYAHAQGMVARALQGSSPQLRTQMAMPMALGVLLVPGVKGAFCAVALFGLLSAQSQSLQGCGSTLMQDVILPLLKKPLTPKGHILALRLCAFGIGVFVYFFSVFYQPTDYLTLLTTLIGAIYLGGIGALVWGGLYWKRGTTAGAWGAMVTGSSIALGANVLQEFWAGLQPHFLSWAGHGPLAAYLRANAERCPINGQEFSTAAALASSGVFVVLSLLTRQRDFNLDRMLHRGKYALPSDVVAQQEPVKAGFRWSALIGIDEHYTRSDKALATATFGWAIAFKICSFSILAYWLFFGAQSDLWWFDFTMITAIWFPVSVTLATLVWLTIGTTSDLIFLVRALRSVRPDDADDGTVRHHHNVADEEKVPGTVPDVLTAP